MLWKLQNMGERDSAQLLLKMLSEHQTLWVLLNHQWDLQGNRNKQKTQSYRGKSKHQNKLLLTVERMKPALGNRGEKDNHESMTLALYSQRTEC